jgi:lysophospholipase L1-like esterase
MHKPIRRTAVCFESRAAIHPAKTCARTPQIASRLRCQVALLLLLLTVLPLSSYANLLSVLGSSVAKGYNSTGSQANQTTNGSFLNSYSALLTISQSSNGWRVVNQSIGGDTTPSVISRFATDEAPLGADEDLIALSLGNEGLPGASNPQAIYNQFFSGITNLMAMSRATNIIPLIGNGYPRDAYTASEYEYLKRMDLQLNTLDAPSINFLGATDDGSGHWINNAFINLGSGDGIHPNDAGHLEMFLTIVPSLFEAVRQGKPLPHWGSGSRYLRIVGDAGQPAPLSLDPTLMHSFSVSFRVRATGDGTVASVTLPSASAHATVEITGGALAYVGTNGVVVNSGIIATNGAWHDVVIAHQYARGLTFFYVDGVLVTTVSEHLTPVNFVLGGPGNASSRPAAPAKADYQDWFVHRSMLNFEEVNAQLQGQFQQASLELYAPLDDAAFVQGGTVTNRAQSFSVATLNPSTAQLNSMPAYLPPTSLSVSTKTTPAIVLNWVDAGAAPEEAYYVERRAVGGAWTNLATLAAHANSFTDSSVSFGTNYQYRVSYASAGLRSGYAVSPSIRVVPPVSFAPDAILIDFGRHDGGVNGDITTSPDSNGLYWNNIGPSSTAVAQNLALANMVNVTNGHVSVSLTVLTTTFQCNGIQNGGLTTPDPLLLGNFAIKTATEDYFFVQGTGATGTLRLSGLNPAIKYNFRLFATRNTSSTDTRTTRYSVTDANGLHSVTLQTSGPGAGSASLPYGNDDTIVSLLGLTPNASGQLDLVVTEVSGGFAYLGILEIALAGQAPAFVLQPQSLEVATGTSTSLVAYASSAQPLNYQWYFQNQPIAGAISTNLPLPNLSVTNVGSYFLVASNSLGAVTSSVATVILGSAHLPSSSVLIDFSRNDGSNGQNTSSPDANGHYWNNIGTTAGSVPQGLSINNLVTVSNTPTTIGLTVMSTTFQCNGILNGGLLSPHYALLGDFAIGTATEDYFFLNNGSSGITGTLRISGLDPGRKYNFSMFATRNTSASDTRTTRYSVTDVHGLHSVNLQTSGPGAGSTNQPYGNDDTIVTLSDLIPSASGVLDLSVTEAAGLFAYIGVLQIVPAPVATFSPPAKIASGWQLQFNATPGYTYRLQRAPEVNGPWSDLGAVAAPVNGLITLTDTNALQPQAFYRTVLP